MRVVVLFASLSFLLAGPLAAQEASSAITEDLIRGHTLALSDDSLQGRGPGSPGEEIAQRYLVREMESLGLEPGVDGEADDDESRRPPGEQAQEHRDGEDHEVDQLVGPGEQRDPGRARRVEDDELDDGGEHGEGAESAGGTFPHPG